jgi:hypothetical protein
MAADSRVANSWIYSDTLDGLSFKIDNIGIGNMCVANVAVSDELVADIFKPERVIFNDRSTICFWKDGSKTVVTTSKDEPFIKEFGIAMATMKKIYGTRQAFLREVDKAYTKPDKKK